MIRQLHRGMIGCRDARSIGLRVRRRQRSKGVFGRVTGWAAFLAAGAAAMFLLDPHAGRHRRALARDKSVRTYHVVTRQLPHRAQQRARYLAGRLRGVRHGVAHRLWHLRGRHEAAPDEVTLAQRVRTEIFAPPDIPDGGVNVDAYAGVVTLRGQLPTREMIDRVVKMARHVEGVREVHNLLHTPSEPVPAR